ncbi:MAG: redoxin domain-containing protein [Gemmatimonadota bacterium]
MNWRRAAVGAAVALPVIALLAYGMTQNPNERPSTLGGRPAPEFALPVMDAPADTARLWEHAGELVVLNFWASWCLECRREHGELSRAAEQYGPQGVNFYGVLYGDTPENGRAWIDEMGGQSYPSLLDAGSRTAIDYGLLGVPETFIIDRSGTVVHKQLGPISLAQLSAILDPLLAASAGATE